MSDTGIDVPNLPKCPVLILMYRYRYQYRLGVYVPVVYVPRTKTKKKKIRACAFFTLLDVNNLWRLRWRRRTAASNGVITAGNQLILGGCAVAHECSVFRYTERTTGRCLDRCWTRVRVRRCVGGFVKPKLQGVTSQCGGIGLMSCRT